MRDEVGPPAGAAGGPQDAEGVADHSTGGGDIPDHGPRCPACDHPAPDEPGLAWWLCWLIVGLPHPHPKDRWGALVGAVADHAGPLTVARGLELAARQSSMASPDPAAADARWWTEADRGRAAMLAQSWRQHAQGVVAGVA